MVSNTTHDEVFSIQHYVITFVSGLRQVGVWPPRYNWSHGGDRETFEMMTST